MIVWFIWLEGHLFSLSIWWFAVVELCRECEGVDFMLLVLVIMSIILLILISDPK